MIDTGKSSRAGSVILWFCGVPHILCRVVRRICASSDDGRWKVTATSAVTDPDSQHLTVATPKSRWGLHDRSREESFLNRATVCPRFFLSRLRATAVVKIEAIAERSAWQDS